MIKDNYKKEIKKYVNYLDEIEDYIDKMDESAGVSNSVIEALSTIEEYFSELMNLCK